MSNTDKFVRLDADTTDYIAQINAAYVEGQDRRRENYYHETVERRRGFARDARRRALRLAMVGLPLLAAAVALAILAPHPFAVLAFLPAGLGLGFLVSVPIPLASARKWDFWADNPEMTP